WTLRSPRAPRDAPRDALRGRGRRSAGPEPGRSRSHLARGVFALRNPRGPESARGLRSHRGAPGRARRRRCSRTPADSGRCRRATWLADLRTPAAAQQALGVPTVSAAVFVRAERRPGERELAAFTRAIIAAEERLGTGAVGGLAAKLPKTVVGGPAEEFEERV